MMSPHVRQTPMIGHRCDLGPEVCVFTPTRTCDRGRLENPVDVKGCCPRQRYDDQSTPREPGTSRWRTYLCTGYRALHNALPGSRAGDYPDGLISPASETACKAQENNR